VTTQGADRDELDDSAGGLWAARRRALTIGLVLTITFVAAEALAVITVLPVVARDLHGLSLYGFVFSAFMLGTVIGIVVAGREADRRGPATPYLAGLALFGAGLVVAGLARSMPVLVVGRALQGLGGGAVPAVAYVAIGRSLPVRLRAQMMAVLSTAWVVPGLAGPALSAEVAHLFGWRWVFLGLLPFVAVTGPFAVPALVRLGRPAERAAAGHRIIDGIGVAVAAGLVLSGLTLAAGSGIGLADAGLILAGGVIGVPVLRRLMPAGTFAARSGLPATVLCRSLLTFAFFGADAFVTLSITIVRHRSTVLAGLAVTGSTLAWTTGAWVQARLNTRWEGRRLIRIGVTIIGIGIGGLMLMLRGGVPVAEGIAAWTVAGLGMGLSYAPLTLMTLSAAPPGRQGWAAASLNLADVLGSAMGIGIGGAAIALAERAGWAVSGGVAVAFGITATAALMALAVSGRLPSTRPGQAAQAGDGAVTGDGASAAGIVPDGAAVGLASLPHPLPPGGTVPVVSGQGGRSERPSPLPP
jgi:MFS family permease